MTPEQAKEAERSATLFQAALVAYGAQATLDSLALWEDIPPVPAVATGRASQRWLAVAVRYVMQRRIRARQLALAYYRYQRALATGKTIALPGQDNPPYVSLNQLKEEFETLLSAGPVAPRQPAQAVAEPQVTTDAPEAPNAAPEAPAPLPDEPVMELDEDRIPVEEIPGLHEDLAMLEEEAEKQIRDNLMNLGPRNQDKKIAQIRNDSELDKGRTQAHKEAGSRQAATTGRSVMNGARGPIFVAAVKDKAAIGFVRVSRTGTPCGFCAMLMSREVVYKSNEGSGPGSDGVIVTFGDLDKYHDNCQCYALPVFSMAQYRSNPVFDANRQYAKEWLDVVSSGGKQALSQWRKHIRQQAKPQTPEAAA